MTERHRGEQIGESAESERDKEIKVTPGIYTLHINFTHRSKGALKLTEKVHAGREYGIEDLAALKKEARANIVMIGLHNFGVAFDETRTAKVSFTLTNIANPEISFSSSCVIDGSGHLVKE